jgi:flagellar protein FliL
MADDKSKSGLKLIIIILVVLLVDIVGGYIIAKKVLIPSAYDMPEMQSEPENSQGEETTEEKEDLGGIHELEAITINPANSVGEIFSCQLTLETMGQLVGEELVKRDPQIKDIIITYFSYKTIQDLNDISKRDEYKKELIEKINSVLIDGSVVNIYTPQWILQFD